MGKADSDYTPEQRALIKQVAESPFLKKVAADLRRAAEDAAAMNAARKRIDRYHAIRDGQISPQSPKLKHHQNSTPLPIDRARRAIREYYPSGADEVSTAAVTRRLAIGLEDENKQLGVKALSYDTVARALGRR